MVEDTDLKLEILLDYLRVNRGFDFTGYKRSSLQRRIEKRMHMVTIKDYDAYLDYLEVHPDEFAELFNTILINVTSFFRNKAAWEYLAAETIPTILAEKKNHDSIRVWCAGCASGEEAYGLAILLVEAIGEEVFRDRVKIYATDVDEQALTEARHARYTATDLKPIGDELQEKYFDQVGDEYTFRSDLRRQVIFGRHDLVQDAPISRLDLLSCRNTLMYMNAETQTRILSRFHFALKETGFLFLGKAEMLLTRTNMFIPGELKHRIFKKVSRAMIGQFDPPVLLLNERDRDIKISHQVELWEGALNTIDLAAIVVNRDGTLLMANTSMQAMFDIDQRDRGRPLQDLEVSYRPLELRSLIDRAYETGMPVLTENVERHTSSGVLQYLDIKVVPLPLGATEILGAGITFTDITRFHLLQEQLENSNQDLETANEELQSSNEELETTNEELQSTNEELETTNEELQSTNEELETMNEELQSSNEELETLNVELRQRTEALNMSNTFLESILASLDTGVIVVDLGLNVINWNNLAEDTWGLRRDEVINTSFLGLDIGLPVEKLKAPLKDCLKTSQPCDLSLDAINRRGQKIKCIVRCSPLISSDDENVGAILMIQALDSED
ncbi:MAG: PAS domain-containing protein [Anaerolineales bacterium]|nr:PAS domain-containing protein [Chloroflexota bacterium]MBL6979599.1 PAS domain-containing protein [Anaerolineales bacterium]